MRQKIKYIPLILFALILIFPVGLVQAKSSGSGLVVCGSGKGDEDLKAAQDFDFEKFKEQSCQLSDIFDQIALVVNALIAFAGVFTVFRLVLSGFQMVAFAGNEAQIKSAREGIKGALIGLILVFLSYLIVNTIFYIFAVKVGDSS